MNLFKYPGAKHWAIDHIFAAAGQQPPSRILSPFGGTLAWELEARRRWPDTPLLFAEAADGPAALWRALLAGNADWVASTAASYVSDYSCAKDQRSYYDDARAGFNALITARDSDPVIIAALFLFLNRACFNGLYRTNRSGSFNVPWGKRPRVIVPSEADLRATADLLLAGIGSQMLQSWRRVLYTADAGDLVYADPPYLGKFSSYVADGFDEIRQRELAVHACDAARRGARVLISNSLEARSIYAAAAAAAAAGIEPRFTCLDAKQVISCKSHTRGSAPELLITLSKD